MSGGGLYDPLGLDRAESSRRTSWPAPLVVVLAVTGAVLAGVLAFASIRDDGDRGRPRVVSTIEHVTAPQKPVAPPPPPIPEPVPSAPPARASLLPPSADQDVEIQNGVRIIRPKRDNRPADSQTILVPGASPAGSAASR